MTNIEYFFNSRGDYSGPWVRGVVEDGEHVPEVGDLLFADVPYGYADIEAEVVDVVWSFDGRKVAVVLVSELPGASLLKIEGALQNTHIRPDFLRVEGGDASSQYSGFGIVLDSGESRASRIARRATKRN